MTRPTTRSSTRTARGRSQAPINGAPRPTTGDNRHSRSNGANQTQAIDDHDRHPANGNDATRSDMPLPDNDIFPGRSSAVPGVAPLPPLIPEPPRARPQGLPLNALTILNDISYVPVNGFAQPDNNGHEASNVDGAVGAPADGRSALNPIDIHDDHVDGAGPSDPAIPPSATQDTLRTTITLSPPPPNQLAYTESWRERHTLGNPAFHASRRSRTDRHADPQHPADKTEYSNPRDSPEYLSSRSLSPCEGDTPWAITDEPALNVRPFQDWHGYAVPGFDTIGNPPSSYIESTPDVRPASPVTNLPPFARPPGEIFDLIWLDRYIEDLTNSRDAKVPRIRRAIDGLKDLYIEMLVTKGRLAEEDRLWDELFEKFGRRFGEKRALEIVGNVQKKMERDDKHHSRNPAHATSDSDDANSDEAVDDRRDRHTYERTDDYWLDNLFYQGGDMPGPPELQRYQDTGDYLDVAPTSSPHRPDANPFLDSEAPGPHGYRDDENAPFDPSHWHARHHQGSNPFDESDGPGRLHARHDENAEAGPSRPLARRCSPNPSYSLPDPEHSDDEDPRTAPSLGANLRSKPICGKGRALDDDLPPSSPARSTSVPLSDHEMGEGKENAVPRPNLSISASSAIGRSSPQLSERDQDQGNATDLHPPPPPVAVSAIYQNPSPSLKRGRDEYEDGSAEDGDDGAMQGDGVDSNYDPNPDEEEPLPPPPKKSRLGAQESAVDTNIRRVSAPRTTGRTVLGAQAGPSMQSLPLDRFHAFSFGGSSFAHHQLPLRFSDNTSGWSISGLGPYFREQLLPGYVDAAESRHVDGGNYTAVHEQSAEERQGEREIEVQEQEGWRRERRRYEFSSRQTTQRMDASHGGIVLHERTRTPDFSQKQDWEWDEEKQKGVDVWMPRFQETLWSMK